LLELETQYEMGISKRLSPLSINCLLYNLSMARGPLFQWISSTIFITHGPAFYKIVFHLSVAGIGMCTCVPSKTINDIFLVQPCIVLTRVRGVKQIPVLSAASIE
jgi:hypothetical protein